MTEYTHLVGAESVQNAGMSIREAAEDMKRAASQIEYCMQGHQRFLDEWLSRLEAAFNSAVEASRAR